MTSAPATDRSALRRVVLVVAVLNLLGFAVEALVAWRIGSVSLLADSVDFLEDTSINLLIALALGWGALAQARAGRVLALVICAPALAAIWQVVRKGATGDPAAPDWRMLALTAGLAAVVNLACTLLLTRHRSAHGALTRGAWLSARNDVLVNIAIIGAAALTAWLDSGWPDVALGALIVLLNLGAAHEVWETAGEETLAAKALAGEEID